MTDCFPHWSIKLNVEYSISFRLKGIDHKKCLIPSLSTGHSLKVKQCRSQIQYNWSKWWPILQTKIPPYCSCGVIQVSVSPDNLKQGHLHQVFNLNVCCYPPQEPCCLEASGYALFTVHLKVLIIFNQVIETTIVFWEQERVLSSAKYLTLPKYLFSVL